MHRDVFICHAPADEAVAAQVCNFLEQEKITCWTVGRDLIAGEDDRAMTEVAVESCPVMVLVLSRESNESARAQDQVERALRNEKILIPLRIENVAPTGRMEAALRHRFRHDAFVGPLDRHLQELVRMLKPLLHRLVVRVREGTSISRTLPSRASIVRGTEGKAAGAAEGTELQLAFHFPHPVFAGHPSVVEMKMTGAENEMGQKIEVTLEGLGLKRRLTLTVDGSNLKTEKIHRISFEPSRSGSFPLHVTAILDDENRRLQLAGARSLKINPVRAMNDLVRYEEVIVNDDKADMFLAEPVKPGEERSVLSDILAIKLPENFEGLELAREFEVSRWAIESLKLSTPLEQPVNLPASGEAGTLLRLEPENVDVDLPHQEIRLVARPTFTVGRSREESDFVAWFWPRNEVHDTKTRRISKKHASFARERATIAIRNIAAGSLTTFDGQDLTNSADLVLDGIGTLNLSGIYELAVARFPSTLNGPAPAPHLESPRGCVNFMPLTANALPQHAVWILTDCSFGASRANPLAFDFPGLAEIQGRFHHDQGLFWIESLASNSAVVVNEVAIERGQVVPLASGMNIKLGEQRYRAVIEP